MLCVIANIIVTLQHINYLIQTNYSKTCNLKQYKIWQDQSKILQY